MKNIRRSESLTDTGNGASPLRKTLCSALVFVAAVVGLLVPSTDSAHGVHPVGTAVVEDTVAAQFVPANVAPPA
jgi:hypothetical protein